MNQRRLLHAWVAGLASLGATACMRPFLIGNFKTTYQPRAQVIALAPLANGTLVPSAPGEVWEAIYGALNDHQHEYTVKIQSADEARRRIATAGVSTEGAAGMPVNELCDLLGTDAVMVGTVTGFIRYGVEHEAPAPVAFGHSEVLVDLQIHDCGDGELLWGYKIKKSGEGLSAPPGLKNRVGGAVASRFPYKRR